MQPINIGVDVGNYDTKTSHCSIPSGYKKYNNKPEIATKVLSYEGCYYVPELTERKAYVVDKTKDDQCLILTLFGIAEELLFIAKQNAGGGSIQSALDKIRHIKLGVGLPPGHFNRFSKTTLAYYESKLSEGVSFVYKNYRFSFVVDTIRIFPQDFVAVYKNQLSTIARQKKKYYIIGIGGGTTDVIPVINGQPDVNHCFSLEAGTRVMYQNIIDDIQRQIGETLDEGLVEDVLRGEDTCLSEDIINLILDGAKVHFNNIMDGCNQKNVKVTLYPIVFFGGGCLLLKDQIAQNERIKEYEILNDIHANAKAYATLVGA